MARQSSLERFLIGAAGGAGRAWYEKIVRDDRAKKVEDQRKRDEDARRAEWDYRRGVLLDEQEAARNRVVSPQSPPLGTPYGGIVPQGMAGPTCRSASSGRYTRSR